MEVINLFIKKDCNVIYPIIEGKVVEGLKIARKTGFPTLNLDIVENLSLDYGVYIGIMEHEKKLYQGVMNIGITPTFNINKPKLEFHAFNLNKYLYGEVIKVQPISFVRKEIKFDNISKLKKQIAEDCLTAKLFFKNKT